MITLTSVHLVYTDIREACEVLCKNMTNDACTGYEMDPINNDCTVHTNGEISKGSGTGQNECYIRAGNQAIFLVIEIFSRFSLSCPSFFILFRFTFLLWF